MRKVFTKYPCVSQKAKSGGPMKKRNFEGNPVKILQILLIMFLLEVSGVSPILPIAKAQAEPLRQTALVNEQKTKDLMLRQLDMIQNVFETIYAPSDWKREYTGWDLSTNIEQAKEQILSSPQVISLKDFQTILKHFFRSTADYHVGIHFISTESATLPFVVQSAGEKIFLAYIDRDKLPIQSFPFQVGDELVEFDDQLASVALAQVLEESGYRNAPATDRSLAEMFLTYRSAKEGFMVPRGPLRIAVKSQFTGKTTRHQLSWTYRPEEISSGPFYSHASSLHRSRYRNLLEGSRPKLNETVLRMGGMMTTPLIDSLETDGLRGNPYGLGNRKSFLPDFGVKLWESDASNSFYAYLYQRPSDRKIIGYVRISTYMPDNFDRSIADFASIIQKFEMVADALIIDQVNNPGGSPFYLYALASMLTDQALYTPHHRFALTQDMVAATVEMKDQLRFVNSDETALKLLGPSFQGFPVSYAFAQYLRGYCQFVIDQWNSGRRLTDAHFLWGVDQVNPSPIHYTKPILLLVNSMDFSGGDFFPAILQDNRRATIFGTRTSGAGGYVNPVKITNNFGIESFSVTASIAWRINQQPIENLGVVPDIPYEVSERDLRDNGSYRDYVGAVQRALDGMLTY